MKRSPFVCVGASAESPRLQFCGWRVYLICALFQFPRGFGSDLWTLERFCFARGVFFPTCVSHLLLYLFVLSTVSWHSSSFLRTRHWILTFVVFAGSRSVVSLSRQSFLIAPLFPEEMQTRWKIFMSRLAETRCNQRLQLSTQPPSLRNSRNTRLSYAHLCVPPARILSRMSFTLHVPSMCLGTRFARSPLCSYSNCHRCK